MSHKSLKDNKASFLTYYIYWNLKLCVQKNSNIVSIEISFNFLERELPTKYSLTNHIYMII